MLGLYRALLEQLPQASDQPVIQGTSRHQLTIFFVGNLLTGAANMNYATASASPWMAQVIVVVYMLVVCAAARWMHADRNTRIVAMDKDKNR